MKNWSEMFSSIFNKFKSKTPEDETKLFKEGLALVLEYEGNYVKDKDDPGGATNKGITQKVYDKYRKHIEEDKRSVRAIADAEVEAIYFESYWNLGKCEDMPNKLALCHFDTCVNAGVKQSSKFLQRIIGAKDDGVIGPKTIKKLSDEKEVSEIELAKKFLNLRRDFYQSLVLKKPVLKKFLKGWLKRVNKLEEYIN